MALPIMGTLCSISYRKNKILTQGVLFGMNDYLRESLSYFGLYIPFYGTGAANVHSQNIAIKSGFKPAWVETEATKIGE